MQESCDKSQCKKYYVATAVIAIVAIAGFTMYYLNASSAGKTAISATEPTEAGASQSSDESQNDESTSEQSTESSENGSANTTVKEGSTSDLPEYGTGPGGEAMQDVNGEPGMAYENTKYGFKINIPKTWGETFTIKENKITLGESGSANAVYFGVPKNEDVFAISMYSKEQWGIITSEEGPTPDYLGENDKYVFGFSTAQDVRDSKYTLIREAQFVVKTFELLQN